MNQAPSFSVLEEQHIYFCSESYLAHTPLSLLLSLRHAVQVLSLVGWHHALLLLLHAHVAAVGQSHAGHHGPSAHHGGWWDGSAHPWSETLRSELHLGLTHVHTCWSKERESLYNCASYWFYYFQKREWSCAGVKIIKLFSKLNFYITQLKWSKHFKTLYTHITATMSLLYFISLTWKMHLII